MSTLRSAIGVLAAAALVTCSEGSGPDPNAVALVVITPDTGSIDTGDSLLLAAVARNADGATLNGKTFTWTTLDGTLVTVGGAGLVRGRFPGMARVVATSDGKSDTARVRVTPRITSLVLTPAMDTLLSLGDQLALSVVAYIDTQRYDGGEYAWERSDTAFLFLSTGVPASRTASVTARKNGSTIVRVREARGANDSAQIVVRQRVARFTTLAGQVSSPYRGCPVPWNVVPQDARGNLVPDVVLTWTSTDTTVARVDASGLISPLAVGTDTILVSGDGASARLPLTVVAAPAMVLQLQSAGGNFVTTVGRTQYVSAYGALGGGTATSAPARFRIVSSDSSVATVTPADTAVTLSSVYSYPLKVTGRSQGTVTLTPYLCDVAGAPVTFTVTRPRLGIGAGLGGVVRTDDSPGSFFISLQDTTGERHYPADSVLVRVTSTDTTVMRSNPTSRWLVGFSSTFAVFAAYVEPGFARLRIEDSAGVYPPDSTPLVQVVYPPVYLYRLGDTLHLGMRQRAFPPWDPTYVYVDRIVSGSPLLVTMTSSDTALARVIPDSVNLPVGNTGVAIDIASGDTRGIATIAAHASRHRDTSAVIAVGRPAVQVSQIGGMFYPGDPAGLIQVIAADSATGTPRVAGEPVTFNLAASDTAVIGVDSTALTIPAGQVVSPHSAAFTFKGPGTAFITATDPRATPYSYAPGNSFSVTVLEKKLVADTVSLGVDQQWGFIVRVEGVLRQGDVAVHLANNTPTVVTLLDSTVTLTPGLTIAGVGMNGLAAGTGSVIVTAPGWVPDTGVVVVGQGTADLQAWPPVYGLAVGQTAPLYLLMLAPNGQSRVSAVDKQFTLTANANLEFSDPFGVPITSVTVPAGQQASPQFWVKGLAAGTGTVTISAPNYSSVTKSVTVAP